MYQTFDIVRNIFCVADGFIKHNPMLLEKITTIDLVPDMDVNIVKICLCAAFLELHFVVAAGEKLIFGDGKKVKQNTKYYYKMRMKYTGVEYDNSWSKWSRVTGAYWTGVKPFKFDDNRIKLNKKTRKVTIPKPSTKVKGYIYSVGASKHLGYNIFGQEVRYRSGARRITTKRIFKVKNIDGMRVSVVYDVIPYTKHGKYYYVHGYKPMKNINKFKEYYGADKYVNY